MKLILGLVVVVAFIGFWVYDYNKKSGLKYLTHNKDQGKVVL